MSESFESTGPVDAAPCDYSRFLCRYVEANPEMWAQIDRASLLGGDKPLDFDSDSLCLDGNVERYTALRTFRNRALAVIAWRDLAGVDELDATLAALSELADRCIEAALTHAEEEVSERHGVLRDDNGEPIRLIVIGMGKLGGGELNFSSDIDLIFAYDRPGCSDGERELDAEGYCRRVAQKMVQTLAETTADGFVYRVDTRLRPFGDVGALVASIAAMEQYYQAHGREWERYAWVKARPVAGDTEGGQRLLDRLRPFVYRRYLDYGTLESIREMKAMIERQVARGEWHANIKLGAGGIREVEFIVQAFQLIRGGQEPELQDSRLRPTLARLIEGGHLPADTGKALDAAYVYLRRVENRLQMVDDRQTHDLPESDQARQVIAEAMGCESLATFDTELADVRQVVQDAFEEVFAAPQNENTVSQRVNERLGALWTAQYDAAQVGAVLTDYGIEDVEAVTKALDDLKDQRLYRALEDRGRRWIARLVPLMIAAASRNKQPDQALLRTLPVISAIIGRSNYIALLVEHPAALETLIRLCAASEWIASRIGEQPALLDSLLDSRLLYKQPRRHELAAGLDEDLAAIDEDDLEQRMDTLRRFNQATTLRIAAADVTNAIPLMIVSDHLTELAEVTLEAALCMAWHHLSERYGTPITQDGEPAPFMVIGYGKLGGLELGYSSDLDLVFLYDGPSEGVTEGGKRELSNQVFFTRLAQRLIHILSTQTPAGRVYEIDMRLRPSGNAGLMVSHIDAFANYQREHAWTWEHQALVRARPVAGDRDLGKRFAALRQDILGVERDAEHLAGEVRNMRRRMRKTKDQTTDEQWDVKQMPGGLIDIEFMAQYAALRYAAECPEIVRFTDAIRILETMESGELARYDDIKLLTDSYRAYRRYIHRDALQRQRAMMDRETRAEARQAVARLWQQWVGADEE
ncbi:MAG: bifunctional [glutamate--ammonia ligase]-adenylyl-L-tyrosine phosphorylase/[glutamate--ammonia-ligase] adenylyltransferase [Salinisphaera sp.]|jgi:glutamate-ammonia-ligase adenylyltransferase|nr:bifunctional [glutamate--ammonia ligase]-adenylyl-L-tyrosine phosphorylase/[glutamate--ammonia-ligase] adenylyltransferase [Salinisphaera sp.]